MRRKGHVTAVDWADAHLLLEVLESALNVGIDPPTRKLAVDRIARLLADKREEWLLCAMVRFERIFAIKRWPPPQVRPVDRVTKRTTK